MGIVRIPAARTTREHDETYSSTRHADDPGLNGSLVLSLKIVFSKNMGYSDLFRDCCVGGGGGLWELCAPRFALDVRGRVLGNADGTIEIDVLFGSKNIDLLKRFSKFKFINVCVLNF